MDFNTAEIKFGSDREKAINDRAIQILQEEAMKQRQTQTEKSKTHTNDDSQYLGKEGSNDLGGLITTITAGLVARSLIELSPVPPAFKFAAAATLGLGAGGAANNYFHDRSLADRQGYIRNTVISGFCYMMPGRIFNSMIVTPMIVTREIL